MAKKTLLFKALSYRYEHAINPKHFETHTKMTFIIKMGKIDIIRNVKISRTEPFSLFIYLFVCLFR